MLSEDLGAGIFIVGSPDDPEFQMGGTARVTDFHDRDVVAMLISDQWQPRGRKQGDAFLVPDERYDPVAADIMEADFRGDIWSAKFSSDKFLEIMTRVIPADQEYIVAQIRP